MNDPDVIRLYFERREEAVAETKNKYGGYCLAIARRILQDERDAEEAVSDALLAAWETIPPNEPASLSAYVGRLCRNAAIDKRRRNSASKRGGGAYDAVLDELQNVSGGASPETEAEGRELSEAINRFLGGLPKNKRVIFVQRYWYMMTEEEIARERLMTAGAVKMQLKRMRTALKAMLLQEGLYRG